MRNTAEKTNIAAAEKKGASFYFANADFIPSVLLHFQFIFFYTLTFYCYLVGTHDIQNDNTMEVNLF